MSIVSIDGENSFVTTVYLFTHLNVFSVCVCACVQGHIHTYVYMSIESRDRHMCLSLLTPPKRLTLTQRNGGLAVSGRKRERIDTHTVLKHIYFETALTWQKRKREREKERGRERENHKQRQRRRYRDREIKTEKLASYRILFLTQNKHPLIPLCKYLKCN